MSDKQSISITAPPMPPRANVETPSVTDQLAALQMKRELLQIQQLEQQLALNADAITEKENKKNEGQALRRSTVAQLKKGAETKRQTQAACAHLKENGKSAVGGQRDAKRVEHWICGGCLKVWTGNDPNVVIDGHSGLPFHLRPDQYKVGGPDY